MIRLQDPATGFSFTFDDAEAQRMLALDPSLVNMGPVLSGGYAGPIGGSSGPPAIGADPSTPDMFYGDGGGGSVGPQLPVLAGLAVAAPAGAVAVRAVSFAAVAARVGLQMAQALWRVARSVGQIVGQQIRVRWNQLPRWGQQLLIIFGVTEGSDLAFDFGDDDMGLIQVGGREIEVPGQFPISTAVVGTWVANGVKFYRLADGKLAVQNTRGRWKVWRPKRPIVLMPTGASNLRQFLRADAVLNRQAKLLSKALARRSPATRRKASVRNVIVETGPGSVHTRG